MSQEPVTDPEDADRAPRAGTILAGKYRVESVVGQGGMGVVVAAQHVTLGQTVAVKLLSVVGLDEARRAEACARFMREGQAAARLTSDHVVRIHDVGSLDDGTPFMVMELLRGDDLGAILTQKGPAPVDVAVEYVVQACDAVGEAHSFGIVHRDLKPSNLFVSRRGDGHPVVKVLDFGISKAMASGDDPFQGSLTATRSVVGSPFYMSPEQVRDAKRVDARSDIWSLGMILYELLVGEPAFNADTLPAICAAIAADTPVPIREKRADVPVDLEAIVMRCLDKDPSKRFPNVMELVRALAPFLPQNAAVSTAQYTSRRLEESLANAARGRRFPSHHETLDHVLPDSGMRLSSGATDQPFGSPGEPGSPNANQGASGDQASPRAASSSPASPGAANPGVALVDTALAAAQGQVVVRDATLLSRTGTSVPAPDDSEAQGVARLAPPAKRASSRNLLLFMSIALLLAFGVAFVLASRTPQATSTAETPRLHEPVGPSPPMPPETRAEARVAAPVAPPVPAAPAVASAETVPVAPPSATPAGAPAVGKSTTVRVVSRPGKALAARLATKPSAPVPTAADIRLER